jgi:hypothetical protein
LRLASRTSGIVLKIVRVPDPIEVSPPGAGTLPAPGFERSSVLPAICFDPDPA